MQVVNPRLWVRQRARVLVRLGGVRDRRLAIVIAQCELVDWIASC